MSRTTIVLAIFVVAVAAIIGVSILLQNQPPLEITIAVDPLAEDWVREAARQFNDNNNLINGTTRVHVNIITENDVRVWQGEADWDQQEHPAGWIPASSASVDYTSSNLMFDVTQDSLANTPLVWGGFDSRVNILTNDGEQTLDWELVADAAEVASWDALGGERGWGFIKLATNRPSNSMAGVGVLLSAASHFFETDTLSRNQLNDSEFVNWLESLIEAVPNFQTLGADPAAVMANRGTSVADVALLPEAQWLTSIDGLQNQESVSFFYPSSQFILDFPYTVWDETDENANKEQAAEAFGDWLMRSDMQALAMNYGLRPVDLDPSAADGLFLSGADLGISLDADYGIPVNAPDRNAIEGLMSRTS